MTKAGGGQYADVTKAEEFAGKLKLRNRWYGFDRNGVVRKTSGALS